MAYPVPMLALPTFDLDVPGTYVFTGAASSRGYALNRFALSLRDAAARQSFLRDEPSYLDRFGLSVDDRSLVERRDWSGLLRAGGHIQALLKLAATVGRNLFDIGAHNVGVDPAVLFENCPRRVAGLGELDG